MAPQNHASFLSAALLKSHIILELIKCSFVDKTVLFQEAICSSKKEPCSLFCGGRRGWRFWQAVTSLCHCEKADNQFRYPCRTAGFQSTCARLACIELTLVSQPVFPCGSFSLCGKKYCKYCQILQIFSNGETFRNRKTRFFFT